MHSDEPTADGPDPADDRTAVSASPNASAKRSIDIDPGPAAADADQTSSDTDQTSSDADQTASDSDQTAAASDQSGADRDQLASDRDQATADRDRAASDRSDAGESAYETSRDERVTVSVERLGTRLERASTARDRDETAANRDRAAVARDEVAAARLARTADLVRASAEPESSLMMQLERLAAQAAADRARAAADRARAATDRANAARERERLEAELHTAHLDGLTGVYRREMGRLELSHEIDRARRSDGRFVVAFVDVDRLKIVNDRDGHAAGDRALQAVVRAIRTRLRSFDPIIRYGGDEFVCGLAGTDLADARRRFDAIGVALEADAHLGISVGFAALEPGDTADQLTERADQAMLEVKAQHHLRQ